MTDTPTIQEVMTALGATVTPTPEVMTVDNLATYLQISPKAVYRMAGAGELPAAKIGDQWRFRKSLIDRWLKALSLKNYTGPKLPEAEESQNVVAV